MISATILLNPEFKEGVQVLAKTISDADGMRRVSSFAIATINCVGLALSTLSVGAKELITRLEDSSKVLSFFGIVNYVKWWLFGERKSWQHTAMMTCYTALNAMGFVRFLEKIKTIDLAKISVNIGRAPVIGFVLSSVNLLANSFELWHNINKITKLNATLKQSETDFQDVLEAQESYEEVLKSKTSMSVEERCKEMVKYAITQKETEQLVKLGGKVEENLKEYGRQKLAHKVEVLKTEISNDKMDRKKTMISIASNIVSLAVGIIAIVGLFAGVAALAATAWPMIALGLLTATIGLFQYLHDVKNSPKPLPEPPKLVVLVEKMVAHIDESEAIA